MWNQDFKEFFALLNEKNVRDLAIGEVASEVDRDRVEKRCDDVPIALLPSNT